MSEDKRLEKVCPICKAAPTGKCLERASGGSYGYKWIDEPHKERYQ